MENEKSPKGKTPKATPDGIIGISVSGYKSIVKPQSIEIRPLTVLAGANSSGKSSIIQPLLLLKQTLDATYDPGPLLLEGPNVTFTSADQFFPKVGDSRSGERFEVAVNIGDTSVKLSFKRHPEKGLNIHEMKFSDGHEEGTLRPEMTSAGLEAAFPLLAKDLRALGARLSHRRESQHDTQDQPKVKFSVQRDRCFLVISPRTSDSRFDVVLRGMTLAHPLSLTLAHHLSRLIHLPGLRGNPERTYLVTGVGSTLPGTFEK